jgi:hypothetical protein
LWPRRSFSTNCFYGQLSQKIQLADVAIGESVGLFFEGFDEAANAERRAQRNGDHRSYVELAAGFAVDARVGLGVIAADNGSGCVTDCREAGLQAQP